ncbi:hypothetical protein BLNAU_15397 [Blattamonas nauphoetae]|uniref:Homeobox domain-containing protein n=1 Tax=Blattamonas nauphoetae TaxID=2049346 RepID=A0ABQ9XH71_9EUKA|nr:hypothetical protein BLNAU_15397 [Blattamonas nauphoetae]
MTRQERHNQRPTGAASGSTHPLTAPDEFTRRLLDLLTSRGGCIFLLNDNFLDLLFGFTLLSENDPPFVTDFACFATQNMFYPDPRYSPENLEVAFMNLNNYIMDNVIPRMGSLKRLEDPPKNEYLQTIRNPMVFLFATLMPDVWDCIFRSDSPITGEYLTSPAFIDLVFSEVRKLTSNFLNPTYFYSISTVSGLQKAVDECIAVSSAAQTQQHMDNTFTRQPSQQPQSIHDQPTVFQKTPSPPFAVGGGLSHFPTTPKTGQDDRHSMFGFVNSPTLMAMQQASPDFFATTPQTPGRSFSFHHTLSPQLTPSTSLSNPFGATLNTMRMQQDEPVGEEATESADNTLPLPSQTLLHSANSNQHAIRNRTNSMLQPFSYTETRKGRCGMVAPNGGRGDAKSDGDFISPVTSPPLPSFAEAESPSLLVSALDMTPTRPSGPTISSPLTASVVSTPNEMKRSLPVAHPSSPFTNIRSSALLLDNSPMEAQQRSVVVSPPHRASPVPNTFSPYNVAGMRMDMPYARHSAQLQTIETVPLSLDLFRRVFRDPLGAELFRLREETLQFNQNGIAKANSEKLSKRNGRFTETVLHTLKLWYRQRKKENNAYATREERVLLCRMTHLTMTQVTNWISNERNRDPDKKKKKKRKVFGENDELLDSDFDEYVYDESSMGEKRMRIPQPVHHALTHSFVSSMPMVEQAAITPQMHMSGQSLPLFADPMMAERMAFPVFSDPHSHSLRASENRRMTVPTQSHLTPLPALPQVVQTHHTDADRRENEGDVEQGSDDHIEVVTKQDTTNQDTQPTSTDHRN